MTTTAGAAARYTWGGDEHLFVEIDEAMSLAANFRSKRMAIPARRGQGRGITDICPANASLLVRFDPDMLAPAELEKLVRRDRGGRSRGAAQPTLTTRIVEIPVCYNDP